MRVIYKYSKIKPPIEYEVIGEDEIFYLVKGNITPCLKISKNDCILVEERKENE